MSQQNGPVLPPGQKPKRTPVMELQIVMFDTGEVGVAGIVNNRAYAYMLLEMARHEIDKYLAKQEAGGRVIEVANPDVAKQLLTTRDGG